MLIQGLRLTQASASRNAAACASGGRRRLHRTPGQQLDYRPVGGAVVVGNQVTVLNNAIEALGRHQKNPRRG